MSRAVRDKWRRKDWYDIYLPRYFGETKVGETPAEDSSKIMGRVYATTLAQITGDFSQEYLKLYFQVTDIEPRVLLGSCRRGLAATSEIEKRRHQNRRHRQRDTLVAQRKQGRN